MSALPPAMLCATSEPTDAQVLKHPRSRSTISWEKKLKPIKHLLTPHRHFFDALVLKNGTFHVVSDFGEGTRMKDIPDEVANLYKSRAHVKALDGTSSEVFG